MSEKFLPQLHPKHNSLGLYNRQNNTNMHRREYSINLQNRQRQHSITIKNHSVMHNNNNGSTYQQRKQLINRKYNWINHSILKQLQHHNYIQINLNNKVMLIRKKQPNQHHQNIQIQSAQMYREDATLPIVNHKSKDRDREPSSVASLTACKSKLNSKIKDHKDSKRYLFGWAKRFFTNQNQMEYEHVHEGRNDSVKKKLKGFTQKFQVKRRQDENLQPWKDDDKQNYESFY